MSQFILEKIIQIFSIFIEPTGHGRTVTVLHQKLLLDGGKI